MANTKTTNFINRAYERLDTLNNIKTLEPYRDMIYDIAVADERKHRRRTTCVDEGYKLTVSTAAKLFTIRWLVTYSSKPEKMPTVAELLGIRADAQLAAMVAANYRERILKALEGIDLDKIMALDYVAMVKGMAE